MQKVALVRSLNNPPRQNAKKHAAAVSTVRPRSHGDNTLLLQNSTTFMLEVRYSVAKGEFQLLKSVVIRSNIIRSKYSSYVTLEQGKLLHPFKFHSTLFWSGTMWESTYVTRLKNLHGS